MSETRVQADVAIVGGGVAGCMTALHLLESNPDLKVAVIEKSTLKRGGNAATGMDHYIAVSPKFFTRKKRFFMQVFQNIILPQLTGRCEAGMTDFFGPEIMEEGYEGLMKLESLGIGVRDSEGALRLVNAAGGSALWIEGAEIKPILAARLKKLGAIALERTSAQEVLTHGGRAAGVVGFNSRTGQFVRVDAPAVLISTGTCDRFWEPVLRDCSGAPFDTASNPYMTGEGQVAALNAGGEVFGLEFAMTTISPVDWATPGISGLLSAGCRLRNALGEEFMGKYDPLGARLGAPARELIIYGMHRESLEGRAPIYIDTSSLSPADIAEMKNAWSNEVPLMHGYVEKKGIVLGRDAVEAEIHMVALLPHICNRPDMQSGVPGLFAAGDSGATLCMAFVGAVMGGARAAKGIAEYLGDARPVEPGSADGQAEEARERMFSYLRREDGPRWTEVERELQRTMTRYFGLTRNENGMRSGRDRVAEIAERAAQARATNPHELMRLHETLAMVELAGITADAALIRTETRVAGQATYHVRSDYPKTSREWDRLLVASKRDGKVSLEARKATASKAKFVMKGLRMLFLGPKFN
ncbi:MAG: FAD-dependent oxidoreductase [Actinomycetota bacterium]